jgi:hypothetical protein
MGMHVRMQFGQVLEALWGRIARAEGKPVLVPPFAAPDAVALRARLEHAGLPASGMETLTLGKDGPSLSRPSLVGWVYWNRLTHLARAKVKVSTDKGIQMLGAMESQALRDVGAYENLHEALNTRASRHPDANTLGARVAKGPVPPADPPAPLFAGLARRLRVAGIEARLEGDKLVFGFAPPQGEVLKLAQAVPHPWLHERALTEIGSLTAPGQDDRRAGRPLWAPLLRPKQEPSLGKAHDRLVEANDRLARMLSSRAPERLVQDAVAQLQDRVSAFYDVLLTPEHLRLRERQIYSGRAVLIPGASLRTDQVGLPDEMAWELFGPLASRELGDAEAVRLRLPRAAQALDAAMARSWIIVNRAPTFSPTAMLAFRPLRDPGSAIRLHPLSCALLDADFDGDQAAIYVPVTKGAQREAGERLSIAGHLARDPSLIASLLPPPEALWGLATLGLSDGGAQEIADLAGIEVAAPKGAINEDTLAEAMGVVLAQEGVDAALAALQRLMDRGFEVARQSGASMSPFIGESASGTAAPEGDDPERWEAFREEVVERLLSRTDYGSPDLGPQLLAIQIRARGRRHLPALICPWGVYEDIRGEPRIVRHSLVEGYAPEEMFAYMAGARRGLASVWQRWQQMGQEAGDRRASGFSVLARARRARHPGVVFARAAAGEEIDPLTDVESRLMVGLPAAL